MNTKQLRQKILDLAIRGQLVPQDNNDEPASVLLEKIRAEKQTLIEQKKIKKDKKSSYITCDLSPYQKYTEHFADGSSKDITDEIPFDIPKNWAWCRLGEIGEIISGGTPSTSNDNYWNGNISWITPADLSNYKEKYISRGKRNISIEGLENSSAKIICKGSVLFSSRAPIGYVVISEKEVTTNQGFKSISPYIENSEHYIYYFLLAEKENISLKASGTTFKELSGTEFGKIFIPLPPLSEQRRIVEKIEELLTLVDDLETNKTDLQSYINQAKSKVLEMAVRGELVPQNPDDEPASALLERIKKEQKSSKSKGKTTEHNTHYEEELPFDIPENWAWCRLGEVCDFERGITFPSSAKQFQYFENSIPCIRTTNVQEELELDDIWFIDKSYTKNNENKLLKINDIIMSSANSRELVGKTCLVKKIDTKFTFGGFVLVIRNKFDYNKYIFYLLRNIFFKGYFRKISTQTTNIANINIALLEEIIIPLPPLAEQHRIVEKIEHIFAVLEELEENIL